MKYYIPWWDDYVDKDYDFIDDEYTPREERVHVTMHHIYDPPPYDGILVSRTKIEQNKKNMRKILEVGIHDYLDFEGPVFGDCGAFGYIKEDRPPFSATEIADYYEQLGFDYGVSVDHLIVKAVEEQKHERFDLTIKNAEKFFHRHQEKGYAFTPIGAVQGWSPTSYDRAVKELLDIGYDYIAIGGLTRSQTPVVLRTLRGIQDSLKSVKTEIGIHLFGVARLGAIQEMERLGVTSFDSASHLRRAWLGARSNYILPGGEGYAAIRIPQSDRSPKAKEILSKGHISREKLEEIESACMSLLRMYDRGDADIDEVLEAVLWYDSIMGSERNHADVYIKTLRDRPWQKCGCKICKEVGVEVIIFRGNNRNRRRGFHNTRVFYRDLQEVLRTEEEERQTRLFEF